MSARLENLGLLQTKTMEVETLLLEFKGLREQSHRAANPHLPWEQWKPAQAMVRDQRAEYLRAQIVQLIEEIKALCADLGQAVPSFN